MEGKDQSDRSYEKWKSII